MPPRRPRAFYALATVAVIAEQDFERFLEASGNVVKYVTL
jgi:hypothetical protein